MNAHCHYGSRVSTLGWVGPGRPPTIQGVPEAHKIIGHKMARLSSTIE